MQTVVAGLSVGRRVESTIGSFDFGVAPGLLAETQTYNTAQRIEFSDTQTDVRLGLYAKFAWGRGVDFARTRRLMWISRRCVFAATFG
jgi:hypothetical protein